ncbi:MAG: SDR family NAD(P)-dependent oxidoreductase [Candidatus Helarchaeota archaeon]
MVSKIKSSRLKDRIALITGAGSGIGRAMAIEFAKEGAKIIIADIDSVKAEETVKAIKQIGQQALGLKTDISNQKDVISMVEKSYEYFERIDISQYFSLLLKAITSLGKHSILQEVSSSIKFAIL